jgi:hypothetical protein
MSYAIGNVIYGVTSSDELTDALKKAFPDYDDREHAGFVNLYEGVSYYYFGIDICEIDEVHNVDLMDLFSKCDKSQLNDLKRRYSVKMKDFPEELKILLSNPKLLIVWSSS